jgi:hypothetical protein
MHALIPGPQALYTNSRIRLRHTPVCSTHAPGVTVPALQTTPPAGVPDSSALVDRVLELTADTGTRQSW